MKNKSVDYYFSGILLEYRFFFFFIEIFDVLIVLTCFVNEINSLIKKRIIYIHFLNRY